jgi:hypothetical protein
MILDSKTLQCINALAEALMDSIMGSAKTPKEKFKAKYGRKKRIIVEVTKEQLVERLIKIECKCEKTGVPFPLFPKKTHYKTKLKEFNVNPMLMASGDRINSDDFYRIDNIQLILRALNLGKGTNTNEHLMMFMNNIKNPPTELIIYEKENKVETKNENNMVTNQKNVDADFCGFLIKNGHCDAAKQFYLDTVLQNKDSKIEVSVKESSNDKKEPADIRKAYWEDAANGILVESVNENEYIRFMDYVDADNDTDARKSAQLIPAIENNIKAHKIKLPTRGYRWYLKKTDVENLPK